MPCSAEIKTGALLPGRLARLVAFGDSITRGYGVPVGKGWVELLSEALKRDWEECAPLVFNAGGNDETSSEGLRRMESDVLVHMPALVFLEFGGNDPVQGARAVSVDQFKNNLLTIIGKIREHGGEIVLLTFPPVINSWHASRAQPYFHARWGGLDQCLEQYRQGTRDVAKLRKVPLFDLDRFLRTLIFENGQEAIIQPDGVHLTPKANQLVSLATLGFLKELEKTEYAHPIKSPQ